MTSRQVRSLASPANAALPPIVYEVVYLSRGSSEQLLIVCRLVKKFSPALLILLQLGVTLSQVVMHKVLNWKISSPHVLIPSFHLLTCREVGWSQRSVQFKTICRHFSRSLISAHF